MSLANPLHLRMQWRDADPNGVAYRGGPTRVQYVDGFVRTSGSFVTHKDGSPMKDLNELEKFFMSLHDIGVIEPDNPVPGNRYKACRLSESGDWVAYSNVSLVKDLPFKLHDGVRVVKGSHGLELQSDELKPKQVDHIVMIEDDDGLVTWFPGDVLPDIKVRDMPVKMNCLGGSMLAYAGALPERLLSMIRMPSGGAYLRLDFPDREARNAVMEELVAYETEHMETDLANATVKGTASL